MLRIGLVGLGGMGLVHLNNYKHIDDCKVVSICEISPLKKEKQEELGLTIYKSIDDMLEKEDIDIVDVCTPTFTHKENVLKALNKGKHVICEKPLALSFADAKNICDLAEKKRVKLFVGHVLQYSREAQILKELVKSKEYGDVLDAYFIRLSACPQWIKNGWLFDKEKSGLLPFDLHIHDLDLIISLFGIPKKYSYSSCGNKDKNYKEHYRFLYSYNDKNICAEASWYNADIPFTAQWRVYFENAVVINDDKGVIAYTMDKKPRIFNTEEKIKIDTGINLAPTGMFYEELSDFLRSIREDEGFGCKRKDEILEVIRILETINESS